MAKKKIVLFDLDGTLIDSTEPIIESFYFACDKFGLKKPDINHLKQTIGHTLENMFLTFNASKKDIQNLIDSYREHYRMVYLQKTKMLPNATKSIQIASEFSTLGIVTTKTSEFSKKILDHFKVLRYFNVVIGIENVTFPKPNAEPITKAIEELKIQNYEAFMIGDTILDSQSAINAGIKAIGVKSGYGDIKDLEKSCERVFKDTLEAINFIKNF